MIHSAVLDGLIFSLVGFALLISFGWLRFPDLTPDGSFVLGGAVYASGVSLGIWPSGALAAAGVAGAGAGFVTSILSTIIRIPPVIAGLITVTGLYSVSWLIMGKPTEFLASTQILWSAGGDLPIVALLFSTAFAALWMFSRTLLGLRLRAFGENSRLAKHINLRPMVYTGIGLAGANLLAAVAGALFAQRVFVADLNSGFGVTLISLVPLFAAGALAPTPRYTLRIMVLIVMFTVVYRIVFGFVLLVEVPGEFFRLISAVFLVLIFATAHGKWATFGRSIRWN